MLRLLATLLLAAASLGAQSRAALPDPVQLAALFGPTFKPVASAAVLVADLDGDGNEDAVIVAASDDPLLDQLRLNYKVIDPYHTYYGFGDPKITIGFNSSEKPPLVLIVHNWRSPRLKFAVINLPFDSISIGRAQVGKRVVPAIQAEERTGNKSFLYWDGKRWRWRDSSIQ